MSHFFLRLPLRIVFLFLFLLLLVILPPCCSFFTIHSSSPNTLYQGQFFSPFSYLGRSTWTRHTSHPPSHTSSSSDDPPNQDTMNKKQVQEEEEEMNRRSRTTALDGFEVYMNSIRQQEQQQQEEEQELQEQPQSKTQTQRYGKTTTPTTISSKTRIQNIQDSDRFHRTVSKMKKKPILYQRDPYDDTSIPVQESQVVRLLALRTKAQRLQQYPLADAIRDELNHVHGVYVWDVDFLWSTSPIAPSRRRRAVASWEGKPVWDKNKNKNKKTISRQYSHPVQPQHPQQQQQQHDFGRHGHDYQQIGGPINTTLCSLTLSQIHPLLAQRLAYKLLKKFDQADHIQQMLYEQGIRIHDGLRQWRADGSIFEDREGTLQKKPYTMNSFSEPIPLYSTKEERKEEKRKEEEESEKASHSSKDSLDSWTSTIDHLISLRAQARDRMNYHEADRIRDQLWTLYRVAVDDKTRTWSIGGYFGPNGTFRWTDHGPVQAQSPFYNHTTTTTITMTTQSNYHHSTKDWRNMGMYTLSPYSMPFSHPADTQEVWNLIHDRLEAKRVKDYHVADFIRDHLYEQYNISIDDTLRQYSVGGDFGSHASFMVRSSSPTSLDGKVVRPIARVYHRRGGTGLLTEQDLSHIEDTIARRAEEISRYNFKAAQAIEMDLRKKYFVVIDDDNGEWYVRGNNYVLASNFKGTLPTKVVVSMREIEALLRERVQAKSEKDFIRSDEIREYLFEAYGVRLNDRTKEWTVVQRHTTVTRRSKLEEDDETWNRTTNSMKNGWGKDVQSVDHEQGHED